MFCDIFFVILQPLLICLSMNKFAFLLLAAFLLTSCGISVDELKQGIIETETKALPLTVQKMEGVFSITIDSMVIINNVDPYYGYLVTTWDINEQHINTSKEMRRTNEVFSYKRVQKKMNVEVLDIHKIGKKYEWRTNWVGAYFHAKKDESITDGSYVGTAVTQNSDDYGSATEGIMYGDQTEEVLLNIPEVESMDVDIY